MESVGPIVSLEKKSSLMRIGLQSDVLERISGVWVLCIETVNRERVLIGLFCDVVL